MVIGGMETLMGADDFILGNPTRDFKDLKAYQDAIQARDWQACEYISNNQELYFLKDKLSKAIDLIERAYPLVVNHKYKSKLDKRDVDVASSIDWQDKANEILKSH